MEFTIAVLPGDGIGPEVIGEAVKVLNGVGERFGHRFDMRSGPIGGNAIDRYGTALPDETLEACHDVDAVLFGAAGGPKWDVADAVERPEQGILRIRREFRAVRQHPSGQVAPRALCGELAETGVPRRGRFDRPARVDRRTLLLSSEETMGDQDGEAAWHGHAEVQRGGDSACGEGGF